MTATPEGLRIVIAEDAAIMRDGLTQTLTRRGHDVVAAVADAETLRQAVEEHRPDVAIIDVRMPPTHTDEGLRAAQAIHHDHPRVGVLVFSQYIETASAAELFASAPAGVGYLLKDRVADVSDFIDAITRVAHGGTVLDPEVVRQLLTASRRGGHPGRPDPAGAGSPLAHRPGPLQRGHRGHAVHLPEGRGEARREHLRQARPGPRRQRQPPRHRRPPLPGVLAPAGSNCRRGASSGSPEPETPAPFLAAKGCN